VELLLANEHPVVPDTPKKFDFYDSILLKVLTEKKLHGADVFTKLFSKNEMKDVFKFLDNETSIAEDMKLISSLPTASFLSAAFSHLIGSN
jgi:lycopene beta-cyclase